MAGNFDFLHIKRRTAGSSNELSFDVLDHKSAEASGKSTRSAKPPKGPRASQGSYAGVSQSSTLSGQAEVEKRKKARRSYRLRLRLVGIVAIVVLVGAGIYAGMRFHENQVDLAGRVNSLVDRLSQVDDTLVEVDAMMGNPFNSDQADERSKLLSSMPKLKSDLQSISTDALKLGELPLDDNSEIAVKQISKSAQARIDMLTAAGDAFKLSSEATEQVNRANRLWNNVLNADQLAREAVSSANRATTQETTAAALEMTREAVEGFSSALQETRSLSADSKADLSAQEKYLAKKVEALEFAAKTNEALLEGNRDAATEANDAYNTADAEAAQIAADLPPSIGDIVQGQYERAMEDRRARYDEARDTIVETDSVIRSYLNG